MTAPGSYVDLTESWGMPDARHRAREMIYRRYKHLADIAAGRRLLELGCGTGLGNHLLAASADELFSFDLEYDKRRQRPTQRAGHVRMLGRAGTPLLAGEPRCRGRSAR